jgi:predicted nucleotidyltransferase
MTSTREAILDVLRKELVPGVQQVFGPRLRSVLVYGSAATGNFVAGVSDVNVLITVDRLDAEVLSQFGRKARRTIRKRRITPLVMTDQEFRASADVFPLEYTDITERHVLILGEDVTEGLDLTKNNLRHQVEDGLRGSLAVLRQAVIASAGNDRMLRRFLKVGYGTQGALLRGLLRLRSSEKIPEDRRAVIGAVEGLFGVDCSAFASLLDLREGGKVPPQHVARSLQETLSRLIAQVDAMRL